MIKTNTIRSQRHDPKVANLQLKIKINFKCILQVQIIYTYIHLYEFVLEQVRHLLIVNCHIWIV